FFIKNNCKAFLTGTQKLKKVSKEKVQDSYFKLFLQFQGTHYFGWQVQPNHPTVQGELSKALSEIFKSDSIKTIGSGRTDTGVHSRSHVVKVQVPFSIEPQALLKGLNSLLPRDILVNDVQYCSAEFLPTNDAKA